MIRNSNIGALLLFFVLLISSFICGVSAAATQRSDALVLVNSASASYVDFQFYIQPYLDNFGIPYTVVDIATSSLAENVAEYAVIIIGHRKLDPDNVYLDATEQANISVAVGTGTGLVNFDNDLSADSSTGRYQFVQDIFGFGYVASPTGSGVTFSAPAGPEIHYITARHESGESISTGNMTLAGIILPEDTIALASTGSEPFLVVTSSGAGRAVQWGTYDWMSQSVKGPVYGLDDLVWRSIVWAARKPFVMQGLPNFVTMRMDDASGPFDWIHIANEFGIKPWSGIFLHEIDEVEAADLSALVNFGQATTSIHSLNFDDFFYVANLRDGPRKDLYWFLSDGKIGASLAGPSGVPGDDWQANVPIEANVWTHVALTYDGSTMVMYKNGVNTAATNVRGALMLADPSSNESLLVGANTEWGEYFHGVIDELRIYNRALNTSEIAELGLCQPDDTPPLPPTNLVSTGQTEHSISLAWDAPGPAEDDDLASAYRIFRDGTQVGQSSNTIFQDTALAGGTCYNYEVYSVDDAGNQSISAASGTFCTTSDTDPPSIVSVMATSDTSVEVVFSESLDQSSAEDISNYAVNNGISIISASLGTDLITVTLITSIYTEGVLYTLTVTNVEDLAGNVMPATPVDYEYSVASDLVLNMRFDDGGGVIASDSSGHGNEGTLVNGPIWTSGQCNSALSFDGSNDYVEVPDGPGFDIADQITITAWISPVDAGGWKTIVSKFAHTPGYRMDLYWFLSGGEIGICLNGTSGFLGSVWIPGVGIDTGIWTHVALTYDGSVVIIYRNGVNVASTSASGALMLADPSSNESLLVGANTEWGEYFHGIIDELRIYNRALNTSEIEELYTSQMITELDVVDVTQADAKLTITSKDLAKSRSTHSYSKSVSAIRKNRNTHYYSKSVPAIRKSRSTHYYSENVPAIRKSRNTHYYSKSVPAIRKDLVIEALVVNDFAANQVEFDEILPDLILNMRFDDGGGVIASDSSGHGNDGTPVNNPDWTGGQCNGALSFDGIDDYVQVPDTPSFDIDNQITITAWIKPEDISGWRTIISKFSHISAEFTANYTEANQWHQDHNIPVSRFVLPHYYQFDSGVFEGLSNWGVEFVGTQMDIGESYGSDWIIGGPYHLYEQVGDSRSAKPIYYADFINVPGHPEYYGKFFNCVTEIRDDAGYEWYPSNNDVIGSIGRGTRQTKRALDSMVLATLFSHGQYVEPINSNNWRAILQGITENISSYNPIYVTMDYACQYTRAMYTSNIMVSIYDPNSYQVTTTLDGYTDLPTMFYLFTEEGGSIHDMLVDVPIFSGSTEVVYQLAELVDFKNLALFTSYWQNNMCEQLNWCGGADFDQSGVVDFVDLMIFTNVWLNCCIDCCEDNNQELVVPTTMDEGGFSNTEGQRTSSSTPTDVIFPTFLTDTREENYGPQVRCSNTSGVANKEYNVTANLYCRRG